jgi:hypothetical protein
MRCNKVLGGNSHEQDIRKELQYLYDRRTAVEALIRSLEYYGQFQERPVLTGGRRKSA